MIQKNYRPALNAEALKCFDPYAHAVTVISEEHRMLHDGFLYYVNDANLNVPAGQAREALLRTGNIPPHLKRLAVAASGGPLRIELYENSTVSNIGTPINALNANRISSNEATMQVSEDPTVTSPGSPLLGSLYVPSGSFLEGVVAETGVLEELILLPNTDYTISVRNDSGGAEDVALTMIWYEIGYGD